MLKIGITGQAGFVGKHLYNTFAHFQEEFERVDFQKEFFEETNVNIDNENLSFVSITERRTRDGKQIKGFLYMYLLETDNRIFPDFINAKDGDEHDNFGYFSVDNLPLNISPQLENVVKLILKKDCRCQF